MPKEKCNIKSNSLINIEASDHKNLDANERFIKKMCAQYLERILIKFPEYNSDTWDFLKWILGPRLTDKIIHHFLELYDVEEMFDDLDFDVDDFDLRDMQRLLRRSGFKGEKNLGKRIDKWVKMALQYLIDELSDTDDCDLEKHAVELARMFELSDLEVKLVIFLYIATTVDEAERYFEDLFPSRNQVKRLKYLKIILPTNTSCLKAALNGKLLQLEAIESGYRTLSLSYEFQNLFDDPNFKHLTDKFFAPLVKPEIPLDQHLVTGNKKAHALKLLKNAPRTPVHILLYGPPGTGKTSFARAIAEETSLDSYEITFDNENLTTTRRSAIESCKNITNVGQGSIIIVDEADEMLNTRDSFFKRGRMQDKGWLNRLLEEPGVRMVWITNDIDDIEKSVLRRFAFSLEFKPFARKQRIQLWDSILESNNIKRLVADTEIQAWATRFNVSAAAIDLAVKKAIDTFGGKLKTSKRPISKKTRLEFHDHIVLTLEAHETLLNGGHKPLSQHHTDVDFTLEGLNVKSDLPTILKRVETFDRYTRKPDRDRRVNMNLLFYGLPGTGKTELARYIAQRLDREVVHKKASDILSMWVGKAEKNIAAAFAEAEHAEAILIIDEIDSMLFNRRDAQHSWEISHTNEFLAQMENFSGIMIGTTNRLDALDDASLRRFNHKIEFQTLSPDGNELFFQKMLVSFPQKPLNENERGALRRIIGLTPGDFKTVRDQFIFQEEAVTGAMLIAALAEEAKIKNSRTKVVGFNR